MAPRRGQWFVQAGYLEDWRFNATLSGTPQGGVASPLLANIYLDRMDRFVEQTLMPPYTRGEQRSRNSAHATYNDACIALTAKDTVRKRTACDSPCSNFPTPTPTIQALRAATDKRHGRAGLE